VVAIDTSFSMAAPETWRAARAAAAAAIADAPAGSDVAVVAFDEAGHVVVPLSADRPAARSAVEGLEAGNGATSLAAALATAAGVMKGRPGTVVLVTDAQRAGLSGGLRLPDEVELRVVPVPMVRRNLSVGSVEREGSRLIATVVNHGLGDRTSEVTLTVDGHTVARQPVNVAGSATSVHVFDGAARERGVVTVTVSDGEGLPADNTWTHVLDPRQGPVVTVIHAAAADGTGGFYVSQALGAGRGREARLRGLTLPVERLDALESEAPSDVVVLTATRGLGREARSQLAAAVERGTGLVIAAGPDVEPGALADLFPRERPLRIEQAEAVPMPETLAPVDVRHPVFLPYADRASVFARIRFDRIVRVAPTGDDRILARFENGLPALVERAAGQGRVLVFASDLDARWNQWPLSPSFVPFVQEMVRYVSRRPEEPSGFTVGSAPPGIDPTPGVHVLPDGRRVAVNVDPRESALDPATPEEIAGAVARVPVSEDAPAARENAERESRQSIWWFLAVVLAGVLAIEGLVGARLPARV
jgi:hypothetical protein